MEGWVKKPGDGMVCMRKWADPRAKAGLEGNWFQKEALTERRACLFYKAALDSSKCALSICKHLCSSGEQASMISWGGCSKGQTLNHSTNEINLLRHK